MLKVGSSVIVPVPLFDELHDHEFAAIVVAVNDGFLTVEDQDGDCFDVEAERVVIDE